MSVITKRRLAVAVTLLLLFSSTIRRSVHADTESPRVVLGPGAKGLVVGPGMNAAGRDLRGCEFVGQDLTGAVFDGCNLYGVRIHQCSLRRTSFRNAVFTGAEVTDLWGFGRFTELEGADFRDATINGARCDYGHFSDLKLSPKQLMSTWSYKSKDLYQCVVCGSDRAGNPVALDLRGADLRQATLRGNLTKCDLTDARIYQARFENFTIAFEQLASTRDFKQGGLHIRFVSARGGLLGKRDFSGINLEGSDIGTPPLNAVFTDAVINGCTLRLSKAQWYSTKSYKQGNLMALRITRSNFSGFDFSGMNLSDCMFSHCKLGGVNIENAVITGARFFEDSRAAKSDRLTLEQIKSTWNYKHGRMEGIRLPNDITKALKAEALKAEALKKKKAPKETSTKPER